MNAKLAGNIMIGLLSLVLLFHFLVLLQIIPFKMVWGGRLNNKEEMYVFEILSIIMNVFLLYTVLQKSCYIKPMFSLKIINGILWFFTIIFALNTIGNLFAINMLEKILGTLLTLISSYLCFIMAKSKQAISR